MFQLDLWPTAKFTKMTPGNMVKMWAPTVFVEQCVGGVVFGSVRHVVQAEGVDGRGALYTTERTLLAIDAAAFDAATGADPVGTGLLPHMARVVLTEHAQGALSRCTPDRGHHHALWGHLVARGQFRGARRSLQTVQCQPPSSGVVFEVAAVDGVCLFVLGCVVFPGYGAQVEGHAVASPPSQSGSALLLRHPLTSPSHSTTNC